MNLRSVAVAGVSIPLCALALGAQGATPFDMSKARTLLERALPCLGCHALGADGGRTAPDLATVRQRRSAEYIAAIIDDPQRVVPGSAMPRTPLAPSTRALLVRFLAHRSVAPAPRRAPVSAGAAPSKASGPARSEAPGAATATGPALYARWCASCHGSDGGGDGPNAQYLPVRPAVHRDAHAFSLRSDDQLFDAIAAGGAAMGRSARMPGFGASLSPAEVRALVAHLRALCQCREPAGSSASHGAPPTP
ncbi:MAG: c-type cytochrome [Gemmatimonadaceae bacterium]